MILSINFPIRSGFLYVYHSFSLSFLAIFTIVILCYPTILQILFDSLT